MVVEDSELMHQMYKMVFKNHIEEGLELIHAENGRDALDKLGRNVLKLDRGVFW